MLHRLGYVAIALSLDVTTNRTVRLANASTRRLRELIQMNVGTLNRVMRFNARSDIRLYRISSEIIPFASHPVNKIPWWEEWGGLLAQIGRFARDEGIRLTMHPGQFTVLNSTDPAILEASLRDLEWHTRLLEALGTDVSSKLVLHVGGAVGGKLAARRRFIDSALQLPERYRGRLVIENDDRVWNAAEVLDIAGETGLPVVFDTLHDQANPSPGHDRADLVARAFATWRPDDGLPKVHVSSQATGKRRGAHADYVAAEDLLALLAAAPPLPFDCMLESKCKDLALFRLREELAAQGVLESGRRATPPIARAGDAR